MQQCCAVLEFPAEEDGTSYELEYAHILGEDRDTSELRTNQVLWRPVEDLARVDEVGAGKDPAALASPAGASARWIAKLPVDVAQFRGEASSVCGLAPHAPPHPSPTRPTPRLTHSPPASPQAPPTHLISNHSYSYSHGNPHPTPAFIQTSISTHSRIRTNTPRPSGARAALLGRASCFDQCLARQNPSGFDKIRLTKFGLLFGDCRYGFGQIWVGLVQICDALDQSPGWFDQLRAGHGLGAPYREQCGCILCQGKLRAPRRLCVCSARRRSRSAVTGSAHGMGAASILCAGSVREVGVGRGVCAKG